MPYTSWSVSFAEIPSASKWNILGQNDDYLLALINSGPGVTTVASSASLTPNSTTTEILIVTALAADMTINAPTGTPSSGQGMMFRIKDNGTPRNLTFNAIYRAIGITLPTATVANKTLYLAARYNLEDTRWDILSVGREA